MGVAIGFYFVFVMARSLIMPFFATWSNQHIDSQVRATVLSFQSQTDAIGQIVGGPPIGAIGQLSLRAAFIASGLILSPALILLNRVRRVKSQQIDPIVELVEG
jgi:DHA3 family tetracycline resistance protein-like MFS transporter